jgi:hypothetical protein
MIDGARVQGLSDQQISAQTGVGSSTFHRWRAGQFATAPDIGKIVQFCEGLGLPAEPALRALGLDDGRGETTPEPPMDPEIRRILRGLNDPNVPDSEKQFAREMLKMLASRITKSRSSGLKDH